MMIRDEFERQLDAWCVHVKAAALLLFQEGVGPQDVMRIATQIADAKLNQDVQARQRVALETSPRPRPVHSPN